MPTVPTHVLAAVAIGSAFPQGAVPRKLWLVGAIAAMAPDLDVMGFRAGIRYGDFWGHRGFTHSLVFAAGLALLLIAFLRSSGLAVGSRGIQWLYLFLAVASHGLLDALTNGGLGIALFAPFDNARYFFPVRPIAVSPIGILGFFSPRNLNVVRSELVWVWLPCVAAMAGFLALHRRFVAMNARSAV